MTNDELISAIARRASEDGRISLHDADVLFGAIYQLRSSVDIHKAAISTLEARDAIMLGVRNDLQARVEMLESQLRDVASGRER